MAASGVKWVASDGRFCGWRVRYVIAFLARRVGLGLGGGIFGWWW